VSRHETGWIEVGEVERTLAALRAGDGHASVRATTLNLVVRCGDAEHVKVANRVLDRIGSSRPLRAMIVMPATGTPRARVSSDSGSDDGRGVFNEVVELRGNRVALPSSVTSLLVADLPVFLWWQGELSPDGDEVLAEMIEMTTRMIVDSDQAGIDAVARVDAMASGLVDLAWVRTGSWREAIAALFDGRSQRRLLDRLAAVEVNGPRNHSALLAWWLRSRLHREVGLVTHRAVRVNRVRLVCGDESFLVERSGRDEHGIASGPGLAPRTVALPSSAVALLLAGELDRLGAERPFEDALAAAQAA
jgi:glucose-6-phosphate dehydrogenase assembly protein OpcA